MRRSCAKKKRLPRAQRDVPEGAGGSAPWQWHKDVHGKTCAYVSIDALNVPQQGPQAAAAPNRMPYVGMVYNPVPDLKGAAERIAQEQGAGSPAAKQAAAAAAAAAT